MGIHMGIHPYVFICISINNNKFSPRVLIISCLKDFNAEFCVNYWIFRNINERFKILNKHCEMIVRSNLPPTVVYRERFYMIRNCCC